MKTSIIGPRGVRACPAIIALYFLASSWHGLRAYFTGDDAGNLLSMHRYFDNSAWHVALSALRVATPEYRPMGGLYYFLLYRWAGFHPLPFRVVCMVLMLVNLWLAFRLLQRFSGSPEAALLGTLLLAHHPAMLELLYSSGTIYEILCFLFYFLAVYLYLEWRRTGPLSVPRMAALIALTGLALDSKEMAMTLPPVLLLLEWIYFRPRISWRGPVTTGVLAAATIAVKVLSRNPLSQDPNYSRHTLHGLLENLRAYQGFLLYGDLFGGKLTAAGLIAIWMAMALAAFRLRSRAMLFGICFLVVGLLPVGVIERRGGYMLYLPLVGWALFIAVLLVTLLERSIRPWQLRAALLLGFAVLTLKVNAAKLAPYARWYEQDQTNMRSGLERIQSKYPRLPHGAHVLLVNDPLPEGYSLILLARMAYGDAALEIDRIRGTAVDKQGYDAVVEW